MGQHPFSKLYKAGVNYGVESSWNVMAHGDALEGKWRENWRKEWVVSTLYTTSEHGVSSITIADAHTSAVSSRLNWRPHRFKRTRPYRRKTKSDFCAGAITFETQSKTVMEVMWRQTIIIQNYPFLGKCNVSPYTSSARRCASLHCNQQYHLFQAVPNQFLHFLAVSLKIASPFWNSLRCGPSTAWIT